MSIFSERLRESRLAKGFTQLEVANCVGIEVQSYQRYELATRTPSFDIGVKLAMLLEVSADYLLGVARTPENEVRPGKSVFSTRLKALRMSKGTSQKDMASLLNLKHDRTYRYYESGEHEPSIDGITILANYFGVTTDYLLGRESISDELDELDCIAKSVKNNTVGDMGVVKRGIQNYIIESESNNVSICQIPVIQLERWLKSFG